MIGILRIISYPFVYIFVLLYRIIWAELIRSIIQAFSGFLSFIWHFITLPFVLLFVAIPFSIIHAFGDAGDICFFSDTMKEGFAKFLKEN
jgi:hypothetical protein